MNKRHEVLAFFVWATVLVVLVVVAVSLRAEEIYPAKEWVEGCQIKGRMSDGSCVVFLFTKTGETENDVDTDEPRVIGFEPGHVFWSKDGEPDWQRIPEKLFLKKGQVKLMFGAKCGCK